jgi:hypothetical protein
MEILRLEERLAEPLGPRPYDVRLTSALELVEGEGEAHLYVLYFAPGGGIGPHRAGFGQLLAGAARAVPVWSRCGLTAAPGPQTRMGARASACSGRMRPSR